MNKRWKSGGHTVGSIAIAAGVLIILAIVLPAGFWWFAAAVVLIIGGIQLIRHC